MATAIPLYYTILTMSLYGIALYYINQQAISHSSWPDCNICMEFIIFTRYTITVLECIVFTRYTEDSHN